MAQLLLMCTLGSLCKLSCILNVISTGSGFVAVLNMYLAVSPLMRWAIGGMPDSLLIRAEGAVGGSPKTYLSAVLCAISMCLIAVLDASR